MRKYLIRFTKVDPVSLPDENSERNLKYLIYSMNFILK